MSNRILRGMDEVEELDIEELRNAEPPGTLPVLFVSPETYVLAMSGDLQAQSEVSRMQADFFQRLLEYKSRVKNILRGKVYTATVCSVATSRLLGRTVPVQEFNQVVIDLGYQSRIGRTDGGQNCYAMTDQAIDLSLGLPNQSGAVSSIRWDLAIAKLAADHLANQ